MSNRLTWRGSRRHFLRLAGLAAGVVVLAACSGSGSARPQASNVSSALPAADKFVTLEVDTATGGKEFKYMQTTLEAPAGSKIKLNFFNKTDPKDEVGHNWVLVKPGQENSVIASAIAAGDDLDWLRVDDPGIVAHTRLIEGNDSDSVTLDAPSPGAYTYLCTFPDHYSAGEKGTLTIK